MGCTLRVAAGLSVPVEQGRVHVNSDDVAAASSNGWRYELQMTGDRLHLPKADRLPDARQPRERAGAGTDSGDPAALGAALGPALAAGEQP